MVPIPEPEAIDQDRHRGINTAPTGIAVASDANLPVLETAAHPSNHGGH